MVLFGMREVLVIVAIVVVLFLVVPSLQRKKQAE